MKKKIKICSLILGITLLLGSIVYAYQDYGYDRYGMRSFGVDMPKYMGQTDSPSENKQTSTQAFTVKGNYVERDVNIAMYDSTGSCVSARMTYPKDGLTKKYASTYNAQVGQSYFLRMNSTNNNWTSYQVQASWIPDAAR